MSQDSNTDHKPSEESPDSTMIQESSPKVQELTRGTLIARFTAVYLTNFLVSLDRTVLAPAIPKITDQFNAIGDIGWYGSSYLLPLCCLQLLVGRLYGLYSTKWLFLGSLFLFAVGSAISGSAPSSVLLIIGRVFSGTGAGGIYSGGIAVMIESIPLQKRPLILAGVSAVMGVSSAVGPTIGGALTDDTTWRWCFYINLPICGVAAVLLLLSMDSKAKKTQKSTSSLKQFLQLDPLGTFLLTVSLVCLLLSIQWGGTTYSWNNARIIALLVLFGLFLVTWIFSQVHFSKHAILPVRIAIQRSIAFGAIFSLFIGGAAFVLTYFLAIWFQAIKGTSAIESGVRILANVIPNILASVIAGKAVETIGYYKPFMILSSTLMAIGAGLMITFTPSTGHAKWIGYQVIWGFGFGCGLQQTSIAAQTALPSSDASVGAAIMLLMITLGGAVFLGVAQSVFTNRLVHNLGLLSHSEIDVSSILSAGATDIRNIVPSSQLADVLSAYNDAIMAAFKVVLACSCLSIIGAVGIEMLTVKQKQKSGKSEVEGNSLDP